jgi:hypothetical protein
LCLRAALAGRRNRVTLDVELYDLQRPLSRELSDGVLRTHLALYDCWLHHRRWARMIESRRKPKTMG